jgi:hypothetical protein
LRKGSWQRSPGLATSSTFRPPFFLLTNLRTGVTQSVEERALAHIWHAHDPNLQVVPWSAQENLLLGCGCFLWWHPAAVFGVEDGRGEEASRRIEEFLVKAMSGHGKIFFWRFVLTPFYSPSDNAMPALTLIERPLNFSIQAALYDTDANEVRSKTIHYNICVARKPLSGSRISGTNY